MYQTKVSIKGMHCRSCEILIERELRHLPTVKKIKISFKSGVAEIFSKGQIEQNEIKKAIKKAGYDVGLDETAWINPNKKVYSDLLIAFVILIALYFVFKQLNIFNLASVDKPTNLFIVLIVGLTAGVSTCMALVGGLVLGITARHAEKHPNATAIEKFRPHLFFNAGRIVFFLIFGGVIGYLGKAFQLSTPVLGFFMIIVAIVMFVLGVQLIEIFPRISSARFSLPSGLSRLLGINRHEDEYSHRNAVIIGALTFFLPCGFTQAMQLYAMSSRSFITGALIMGMFALGTTPGLLGIGGLTSVIKGSFASKFFKFAGLLVIFLAIINFKNGLNLAGINIFSKSSAKITADDPNIKVQNGVQIINMTQTASGYKPNKFTIRQGIPVKWIINSTDPGSCSASIVSTPLNVKKYLSPGENTIEFTPENLGQIKFSCSMGMYSGKFTVVKNDEKQTTSPIPAKSATPLSSTTPTQTPSADKEVQIIKTTYIDAKTDIEPKEFTVIAGKPVRFEIDSKVDARGCMGSITVSKLVQTPQFLEKGKTIVFEFTPEKGSYYITCGMGAVRGKIVAN